MSCTTSSPHNLRHLRQHTSRMMLSPHEIDSDSNLRDMASSSSPAPIMITSQELHELEGQTLPSAPPHGAQPSAPLLPNDQVPVMIDRNQLIKKLMACSFCDELPKDAVESVCCGKLYCWECAVLQTEEKKCSCGATLTLEAWKPAKAVERMLRENVVEATQLPKVVPCPECGKTFRRKKIEAHLQKCEDVLLPCAHCFVQLKRGQLADHVNTVCPLAPLKCPFGCEDQLARREMDDHLEQNAHKHLNMLQQTVERQQAVIEKLDADTKRSVFERIGNMNIKQALAGLVVLLVLMWLRLRVTPTVIVICFFAGLFLKLKYSKKRACAARADATNTQNFGAATTNAQSTCQNKESSCAAHLLLVFGIICFLVCVF